MGSPPDKKFWVAVQIPDDEGYVVVHSKTIPILLNSLEGISIVSMNSEGFLTS